MEIPETGEVVGRSANFGLPGSNQKAFADRELAAPPTALLLARLSGADINALEFKMLSAGSCPLKEEKADGDSQASP